MADKGKKIITAAAAGLLGISCGVSGNQSETAGLNLSASQERFQESPNSRVGSEAGLDIRGYSDRILAVDSRGDKLWQVATSQGVTALFLHESGILLAGLGNRILMIDSAEGKVLEEMPQLGNNSYISSLSYSRDGIFAADRANGLVYRFSREGALLSLIGNNSPEGIRIPGLFFSVSSAGDGKVWVSNPGNHKVEAYDLNGSYLGGFGTAGPEGFIGCCNPISLLAMSDGTVLAGEKGLLRVRRFNVRGDVLDWIAGGEKSRLSHLPTFLYMNRGMLNISDGIENFKVALKDAPL